MKTTLYLLLKFLLYLGLKDFVYKLSLSWASLPSERNIRIRRAKRAVAKSIQPDLVKAGFYKCPACNWATRRENEHTRTVNDFSVQACKKSRRGTLKLSYIYEAHRVKSLAAGR